VTEIARCCEINREIHREIVGNVTYDVIIMIILIHVRTFVVYSKNAKNNGDTARMRPRLIE